MRALTYRRKGLQEVNDERTLLVAARPLTFGEFVEMFGEDDEVELIDGVVVQRMAARLEHETLQVWLLSLLNNHVQARALGIVLGSRTAVQDNGASRPVARHLICGSGTPEDHPREGHLRSARFDHRNPFASGPPGGPHRVGSRLEPRGSRNLVP